MADGFYGEVRLFAGTYAPRKWAFCYGQLLPVTGNGALFSLLGTSYGGDGITTFALPDFRGRIPVHKGQGPGLQNKVIGSRYGVERVSLATTQIPSHSHALQASANPASSTNPQSKVFAETAIPYYDDATTTKFKSLSDDVVENQGSGNSHYNLQPYLCLQFIICINGIYPSRN